MLESYLAVFNREQLRKLSLVRVILSVFNREHDTEKVSSFTINIHNNPDETYYPPHATDGRIYNALRLHTIPTKIDLEHITPEELHTYARKTNSAPFHFSGNCELLADVLMYNLLNQHGHFLSVQNIYPPWKGAGSLHRQLLGDYLRPYSERGDCGIQHSMEQLEQRLLACHRKTNEVVFKIKAHRHIPLIGDIGHCFNAIILKNSAGEPYVQFLDAWLRHPLPTKEYLAGKYKPNKSTLSFSYCPNKKQMSQMSLENTSGGVEVKARGEVYKPGRSKKP